MNLPLITRQPKVKKKLKRVRVGQVIRVFNVKTRGGGSKYSPVPSPLL